MPFERVKEIKFTNKIVFESHTLRNYLYFCSNVDHHGDYCRTTTAGTFRTNSWYKIEIKQRFEAYQVIEY